ncbi:MAG: 2-oxoglutarate dehydrogenase, E2 component, dihydrolipoamide succinyltransferase [Pseudonocardia sp.]|nr:2-oxoglutarate dehydrogenase, E2 component, dihydrolipoamide succinyltransferase [Pseudonocardia sp.]
MAFTVQMPALGESVTEGTVTRWLKQEGDRVEVDEPLLEVSTDKVDTEIPSPAAGVLERIVAGEDETVEIGGDLAVIGDGGGSGGSDGRAEQQAAEVPAEDEADAEPQYANQAAEPAADAGSDTAQDAGTSGGSAGSGGAATPVTMPELGESVTEGTVTRWLKGVGDTVEVDEPLLEVSTDKVDTEIPSPVAGTLLSITVGEDETVQVGAELAVVGDPGRAGRDEGGSSEAPAQDEPAPAQEAPRQEAPEHEAARQDRPEQRSDAEPERAAADDGASSDGEAADGEARAPYVTPLVRKLAAENSVDLSTLSGSGVGGRIRKQDVLAAAEQAAARAREREQAKPARPAATAPQRRPLPTPAEGAPEPGTTVKMPRLRQVIAQRMTESLQVSAQLTTVQEVDVTRIARLRARAKAEFERREGVKLTYLPFFAKATIEALKAYPQLNASIDDESREVTYHGAVHLAIAVDTARGLLVPVIPNADELNIAGLARHIADLGARTRDNKVGPNELSGGTFTITNIGSSGALLDTPIINQPQVAILGTGSITKEAKVVAGPDGEDVIAIRSVCFLPLTYDHRLVDGADAGRFLTSIRERLEGGSFEADLGL